jgi:hypothetical protein
MYCPQITRQQQSAATLLKKRIIDISSKKPLERNKSGGSFFGTPLMRCRVASCSNPNLNDPD